VEHEDGSRRRAGPLLEPLSARTGCLTLRGEDLGGAVQPPSDEVLDDFLRAADELGDLGPFTPRSLATLVGLGFMGGESMLLLGEAWTDDVFGALQAVGALLKPTREGA
jgi:hypothetical protein